MHFEGSACKKCGGNLRYVKSRACVSCGRAHSKDQRSGDNYGSYREYQRAYQAAQPKPLRTDAVRAQENARYRARAEKLAAAKNSLLAAHADEIAAQKAKRNEEKAERKRQYMRRWRVENRTIASAQSRSKKARRRNAPGTHTAADVIAIGNRQKWRCAWCKKPCADDYHVDHMMPLIRGGSNWPSNLCISCPTCNMRKKAKLPHEFAQTMGMLL